MADPKSTEFPSIGNDWPRAMPKSGNDEWYTPTNVVEVCRAAMGGEIDLDPASNDIANKVVRARQYYTKVQDGLAQPWSGNVFLNPPYSVRGNRSQFIEKLAQHFMSGDVVRACLISPSDFSYQWANRIRDFAVGAWFPIRGGCNFWNPDPSLQGPSVGTACFFFTRTHLDWTLFMTETLKANNGAVMKFVR